MAITTGHTAASNQAAANAIAGSGDTVKAVLIKVGATGTYDSAYSTAYAAGMGGDECPTAAGYTQGGVTLGTRTAGPTGAQGWVDYADPVWTAVGALSVIGCGFWNVTQSRWVGFIDFGGTKTATDGAFTVQIPGDAGNGLVRIG